MRKWIIAALLLLVLCLASLPALAQTYVLDDLFASVVIPDTYILITPDNAASNAEWLQARGTTSEETANDLIARGVLLQCWSAEGDTCFELTATQSDKTLNLFDVNEQSTSTRAQYRLSHYPENLYADQGYNFTSADWKNTQNGRFLILRYIHSVNGEVDHRGFMRRTIRNGYEITFDMRVYGRSVTNKDNTALNKIWDTFNFIEVKPLPPAASAKVNITEAPPTETNDPSFTLSGTAAEGVKFTAVVMGLSYPTPILTEVEVGKNGKFKIPIKLPKEGVFMVTVTAEMAGEDVLELAYPVTYQRTLLTVNVTSEVPEQVTTDTLAIVGNATPGSTLQVLVNDENILTRKIPANGRFKVELDTSTEGSYSVVLAFSKVNLADRRLNYLFSRVWSQADMVNQLKREAISPGYGTLLSKIDGYDSRIMGYKSYLVSVTQAGDSWIMKMALSKSGSTYSGIILVTSDEVPAFAVDTRVMMYGRCVGMSIAGETGSDGETQAQEESYPLFELLLMTSL